MERGDYNGAVGLSKVAVWSRRLPTAYVCAAGLGLIAITCTSSVSPSPTPTPPPVVVNTPPTIRTLATDVARAEAGTDVKLTAIVDDAETPPEKLTYSWSGSPIGGTFTETGPGQATWHVPSKAATPTLNSLTLTVTETYMSAGTQKENRVSSSVQVHYNDSVEENTTLALGFLTDFSTYSVSPEQCVRNFSDNCQGKEDELADVQRNRDLFHILGGTFSVSSVELNSDKTKGAITAPCTFEDTVKATGVRETVVGTCVLTSVYEDWKWLLCVSHFDWDHTTTSSLRMLQLRNAHP